MKICVPGRASWITSAGTAGRMTGGAWLSATWPFVNGAFSDPRAGADPAPGDKAGPDKAGAGKAVPREGDGAGDDPGAESSGCKPPDSSGCARARSGWEACGCATGPAGVCGTEAGATAGAEGALTGLLRTTTKYRRSNRTTATATRTAITLDLGSSGGMSAGSETRTIGMDSSDC